jgi:plastocyanin
LPHSSLDAPPPFHYRQLINCAREEYSFLFNNATKLAIRAWVAHVSEKYFWKSELISEYFVDDRYENHYHLYERNLLGEPAVSFFRICLLMIAMPAGALAADREIALTIKDHRFEPAEVRVPAGEKVKLMVHNQDATPEEFESHKLNREKIVPGNSKATIYIGPLSPGQYPFFGEFNQKTAQGVVIAE